MKSKNLSQVSPFLCLLMFISISSFANNISVSNISLTGQNVANHYSMVKFDISWENSWRLEVEPANWDAAWVFVKYRIGTSEWQHARLNNSGHINPAGSTINTGLLNPSLPFNQTTNPGLGTFIYRDAIGAGTFSKTGVQLRWNYGANGVADNAIIDIRVYAIEQVYVPQGSFYVGSGTSQFEETSPFYKYHPYPVDTIPFQIGSEGAITVGTATDNLYYANNPNSGDQQGPIPSAFPKGYNAFYCMKYEITQQGYVDFLNNLNASQAYNRSPFFFPGYPTYRNGITVASGVYSTTNPYVACNYLGWNDLASYLAWSGFRPMTELEFEKSCRGSHAPVRGEFAWGNRVIENTPYTLINMGANNENISVNYSLVVGNAAWTMTIPDGGSINGPVRVGIFAGNGFNIGRVTSGATYYGIMEMSGNLSEVCITVGNPEGRSFTNEHGNGMLDSAFGEVLTQTWPIDGIGAGLRGGNWYSLSSELRVSDRYSAVGSIGRYINNGGRGVRSAP